MMRNGHLRVWVQKRGKRVWYSAILDYQNERGHWLTEPIDPDIVKCFLPTDKPGSKSISIEEAPLPGPVEKALSKIFTNGVGAVI